MAINFGNDKIKEIYHGSDKIKEVYYGSELVYTAYDPRGYWVHKDTGVITYFGLEEPSIANGIMSPPFWRNMCSKVKIPEGVTRLQSDCFFECASLTSITLPESVNSIGSSCFEECVSLTLATVLPATPPSLGSYAFLYTHATLNIKVRSPYVNAYKSATNWTAYSSKISAI